MAKYEQKLVFIDGFAGPGVYDTGEPGSPIVALRTLLDHSHFSAMAGTTFLFIFVEQDPARAASLEEQIDALWAVVRGQPSNVKVRVVCGDFEEVADSIVGSIQEGFVLAPALAFIDPFGFKGVSLATICRLTSYPKCEVIFSFMYDGLNRWITHPDDQIHVSLRDLFGTDQYEEAAGLSGSERRAFLHDLYMQQLQAVGHFEYTLDFEMIDSRGRNVYSLIFGTRHIKGLEAMKGAMWEIDPSGGFSFSDRHHGMTKLFDDAPDVGPLRAAMLARFSGQEVRVDEALREWVLSETIFGASHYKKQVLKDLQTEGLIVPVSGQRRRGTFPDGTVIRFVN